MNPTSLQRGSSAPRLLDLLKNASRGGTQQDVKLTSVLFVLEGVLVDTVPADLYSLRAVFSGLGCHILPSHLYARAQHSVADFLSEMAGSLGLGISEVDDLQETFTRVFAAAIPLVQRNTWMVDLLRELSSTLPTTLVSERTPSAVRSILSYHALADVSSICETGVWTQGEPGRAERLRRALEGATLDAAGCVVIGPSTWEEACTQVGASFLNVQQVSQAGHVRLPPRRGEREADLASKSSPPRALATVRDVARRAGVSTATVSRALNEPASVSEERRGRILLAVKETGYIPNFFARNLSRRSRGEAAVPVLQTDAAYRTDWREGDHAGSAST